MKELINKNKNYIKETLLLLLGGIIINLACFFMGTLYSNAATLPTGSLPYNVTEYKDLNPILTDSVISALYNDTNVSSYLASCDNYIMYIDDVFNSSGRANIEIRIIKNPYTDNIYDSNWDFLSQRVLYYGTWGLVNIYLSSDGSIYRVQWRGTNENNTSFQLLGAPVPTLNTNVNLEFTPRYPFAIKSTVYDVTGNNYVFVNAIQIIPGEFTDLPGLDEILNNLNNNWEAPSSGTGHALPNQPTENPNNSDFQNRLQMFDYLKDSFNSIIGNLGYNLKNWFDNLMGKMVEGFNSVSQNVYNGFKTLMDNIKDFFGPKIDAIIEKFNYITEPFDTNKLTQNLNNSDFSSDFLGLTTTISTFGTAFTSGTEPSSCSFTLDFSNSYYNFGVCDFSLDWILPFRSAIRLIVGCLCVYSLIVSIFTSLNTYIGGTSSINDDI